MKNSIVAFVLGLALITQSVPNVYAAGQDDDSSPVTTNDPSQHLLKSNSLNTIHHSNILEIEEARLALQRSKNHEVREFAQYLVHEHSKNEKMLRELAQKERVAIYKFQRSTFELAADDQLNRLQGRHFDKGYVLLQVLNHQRLINDLEIFEELIENHKIKDFIKETKESAKKHLERAEELLERLDH